jgi:hypothetical protein
MLLRQLSNAAATPRRFWRWAIFLVVVVLAAIQYKVRQWGKFIY